MNRNALREALKRLQQQQLITTHAGGASRVLDFRRTAGLDLLVALLVGDGGAPRLDVARSLVELRTALGPDIAAHAAERGGPATAKLLEQVILRMEAAKGDVVLLHRESFELWRHLVDGSGNVAYRLLFNTLERAWGSVQDLVAPALADEVTDLASYRAIARAVAGADSRRARRVAQKMLLRGQAGIEHWLKSAAGRTQR